MYQNKKHNAKLKEQRKAYEWEQTKLKAVQKYLYLQQKLFRITYYLFIIIIL